MGDDDRHSEEDTVGVETEDLALGVDKEVTIDLVPYEPD